MTTIKEIQELATQADDWTKRRVAENLLKAIEGWQPYSARLEETYRDLHKSLTSLVGSYPKYPDDIPRSVSHFESIIHISIMPEYEREGELSVGVKVHADRIYEYLDILGIYGDDEDQLWEEIIENKINEEDN